MHWSAGASIIARLKKDLEAVLLLNGNALAADFSRPSSNRLAPRWPDS